MVTRALGDGYLKKKDVSARVTACACTRACPPALAPSLHLSRTLPLSPPPPLCIGYIMCKCVLYTLVYTLAFPFIHPETPLLPTYYYLLLYILPLTLTLTLKRISSPPPHIPLPATRARCFTAAFHAAISSTCAVHHQQTKSHSHRNWCVCVSALSKEMNAWARTQMECNAVHESSMYARTHAILGAGQ